MQLSPSQWGRLAVLLGLLLGTNGFAINDEQEQATGLYNVLHGSLLIRDHPEIFYPKVANLTTALRYPGPEPIGSPLLNFLAVPMVGAVRLADALMPLGVWFSLLAVALAWSLLPASWGTPRGKAAAVLAVAVLATGFRVPEHDPRYLLIVALQLTNLLALGLAAGFIAAAIQRHVPAPYASLAIGAVLLGPVLFWGSKVKYTILAAALTAMALWVAGEPASRRRAMAMSAVAAFAIWNNIGPGLVVTGAVGFLLLGEALARPREAERWKRFAAGAAFGAFSLAGWAAGNQVISGNPLVPAKIVREQANIEAMGEPTGGGPLDQVITLLADPTNWDGPKDLALDIVGLWTTGARVEGAAIGVLALSPLLALGAWTLLRTRWRLRPDLVVAVLALALQVALFSNRVVIQGWGFDARLVAPVLPAVGLLAAPGIHHVAVKAGVRPSRAWAVALLAGGALTLALVLLAWHRVLPYGFKHLEPLHDALLLAIAVAFALALAAAVAGWSRLLPRQAAASLSIGLLLAIPVLWTLTVALATPTALPSEDGESRGPGAFVPLADAARTALHPHLFPAYALPVIKEDGVTVFHPSYGFCRADPNPCPW